MVSVSEVFRTYVGDNQKKVIQAPVLVLHGEPYHEKEASIRQRDGRRYP